LAILGGGRMNVHKNARLTPLSRAELVRRVLVEGQAPMTAVVTAVLEAPERKSLTD
jgi:hypothetical protein